MEGASVPPTASQLGEPIRDIDAWLRRHLGRQLTIALVLPAATDHAARELADALAAYSELRVLARGAASATGTFLDSLAAIEPEIVLVWAGTLWAAAAPRVGTPPESAAPFEHALRQLLDALDARGLLDRAFVALIGPGVTREGARRLGVEDGFPASMNPAELAAALAREGLAVDDRRRHGSSPPCYL